VIGPLANGQGDVTHGVPPKAEGSIAQPTDRQRQRQRSTSPSTMRLFSHYVVAQRVRFSETKRTGGETNGSSHPYETLAPQSHTCQIGIVWCGVGGCLVQRVKRLD
jgi:hypothetical protein